MTSEKMKYIITNCPLYEQYDCFNTGKCKNGNSCNGIYKDLCKDITDCVMKRIAERCNLYEFNYPVNQAIQMLTQNIKDMLEIEEYENE